MKNLSNHLTQHGRTPQRQAIPGRESEMSSNAAGGYGFLADDWERLDRFLILGTEGGTYYASEQQLTVENAAVVRRCARANWAKTLTAIESVSDGGRAPKNDPAILALAIVFAEMKGYRIGESVRGSLLRVCRTGTHLFQFLEAVTRLRGGGRMLNGAVRYWIDCHANDELAYQMVKYRSRAGWTWRDVFRRYRPKAYVSSGGGMEPPASYVGERRNLFAWAAGKLTPETDSGHGLPAIINDMHWATQYEGERLAKLIAETKLPWECVPTDHLNDKAVLGALMYHMPLMALVRNLPRFEAAGLLEGSEARSFVTMRLTDAGSIKNSRIHPVALMIAAHYYEKGANRSYTWRPRPQVVDALDTAFRAAFDNCEALTGRMLIAVDVSGSMSFSGSATAQGIPAYQAAAAMAMPYIAQAAGAPAFEVDVVAFDWEPGQGAAKRYAGLYADRSVGVETVPISARQRTVDVARQFQAVSKDGGTDCALPFRFALEQAEKHVGSSYDSILIFTDNETWAGDRHPAEALSTYRAKVNSNTRVVWCALSPTDTNLGLPEDGKTMGIAGFDSAAPRLVQEFLAGRLSGARDEAEVTA